MLCVLAVLVSPALISLVLPAGVDLAVPYGRVLTSIAVLIFLPLGIGLFVREKAPGAAPKLAKVLGIVGALAFVAFMIVSKSFRKEAVASIGWPAFGAMIALIVGSMAIGWLWGGPVRESRQILATTTSMRNAALCLAIAESTPSGDAVIAPLVAFSLLMVPPNMLFTVYNAIRARKAAGKSAAAPASGRSA